MNSENSKHLMYIRMVIVFIPTIAALLFYMYQKHEYRKQNSVYKVTNHHNDEIQGGKKLLFYLLSTPEKVRFTLSYSEIGSLGDESYMTGICSSTYSGEDSLPQGIYIRRQFIENGCLVVIAADLHSFSFHMIPAANNRDDSQERWALQAMSEIAKHSDLRVWIGFTPCYFHRDKVKNSGDMDGPKVPDWPIRDNHYGLKYEAINSTNDGAIIIFNNTNGWGKPEFGAYYQFDERNGDVAMTCDIFSVYEKKVGIVPEKYRNKDFGSIEKNGIGLNTKGDKVFFIIAHIDEGASKNGHRAISKVELGRLATTAVAELFSGESLDALVNVDAGGSTGLYIAGSSIRNPLVPYIVAITSKSR